MVSLVFQTPIDPSPDRSENVNRIVGTLLVDTKHSMIPQFIQQQCKSHLVVDRQQDCYFVRSIHTMGRLSNVDRQLFEIMNIDS